MTLLRRLYTQLDLPETQLVITDENTGAGYIVTDDDRVFARWSTGDRGVALLSIYVEAARKLFQENHWK